MKMKTLVINENLAEKVQRLGRVTIGLGLGWAWQKNSNSMFNKLLVWFEMMTEES